MSTELLSIGQVAQTTGVTTSALRYYDERGLISVAERVGGQRRFTSDTVGRVNFVQRCQDAGFSLDEIAAILDDSSGNWRAVVENKIAELTNRRDHLTSVIDLLHEVQNCGCTIVADCPVRLAPR